MASVSEYVPRSPRRATRLRAVVDDGARRAVASVRDMSTSGLFVESSPPLALGTKVAVVPLLGELDGERLPAEVARIAERGLALRFLGLDPDQRQRLRRTFANDNTPLKPPRRSTLRIMTAPIPENAPVFLLTDDDLADAPPPVASTPTLPELASARATIERLEAQLLADARGRHVIVEENGRLKREAMALQARLSVALSLRMRVDDDLAEARATIDDLLAGEDALIRRVQTLEELLRRAMVT
jgi:hypothetical protein